MTHSLKAVLLSGLVFPGLGQLLLGHRMRAAVFMLAVSIGLTLIVHTAMQQAYAVLDHIQATGGALDIAAISNAATQASSNSDNSVVQWATIALLFIWVASMVDAYFVGRLKDCQEKTAAGL